MLGLVFESYEGGIKKDHPTLSYYFITSGLAICVFAFAPHILFLKSLFGFDWPALPNGLIFAAGVITAGQEIFTSDATDQPCGLVAQVATVNDQTYAVVELQTSVVDENKLLHVGGPTGPQLHVLPLPYVLRDDI